ncbi:hypothetical protein B484DRAFT_246559 [Ochromonadaceae sp. CCMP2298]|nr:hypothetical protein B484DRAFT_246559 [Ochromonadaceae sp. CCMP2298]
MEAAVAAEAAAAVAAAAVAAAAAEAAAVVEAVAGTAERQAATTVASDSIKAGVQIVSRPGTAETPMDKAVGDDSMAFEPPVEAGVEVEVGAEAGVEVGAEAGVKAEARVEAEAGVGSPGPRPTTTSSDAAPPHPLTSEDSSSDASEIASNYSEVASAPTHTMLDWEVTADFSISLSQADRKTIDQTFKDALYAFYRARYQRSSDILERFLPILAAFPSQDPFHPDVARIQSTIKTLSGRILLAQGRFPEAQEVFEDALQHRVEVFGKQHFLCVELLQYLAELHCLRADYDKGEVLYEQALGVVDALGGKNSHGVQIRLQQAKTRILVGRADLLTQRGQYYTASGVLSRAQEGLALLGGDVESLEIQEKFVTVWVDLLVVRGKRGQAVSLLQELLDTRRLRYGPQHPSIAASLIALADVKLAGCEFAQAAELVEEGLSMYRLAHVPAASNTSSPVSAASATTLSAAAHPAIATALLLRGRAFAQLGRYGDATADVLLSLDMRREALGSAHPLVALSTHVLADIEAQNPLRAQANLTLALKSLRTCLGQKHHLVGDCLFSLATNAEVRGAYLEAAAFHEEALEVREAIVQLLGKDMPSGIAGIPEGAEGTEGMGVGAEGTEGMGAGAGVVGVVGVGLEGPTMHIDIEVSRLHLGRVYGMLSRFPQAKIMLKNAVKNITSLVGNRHTLVARALLFLGELCCRRGNHADAKQLYCLSFNILQELFGDHHPSIAEVLLASAENLRLPGLYPEALDLQLSAYDLSAHVHGNDSLAVAQALFLRAQMLRDGGQTAEAERAFVRAVHVVLQRLGEGGLYGVMLGEFAECCRVIGNLAQAEKYFKRSLEVQRAAAGESLGVLCTLLNLSLLLMDMHRPAEAADILSLGVLPPLQELLGAAHPTSMYAKANLALAVSFARFEVGEGTIVLEALLSHPDVKAFVTQCGTSLAPAHPWLTRFAEGGTVLSTARSEGSSLVTANVPSGKDSLIPSQSQGPSYSETDSTGPGTPVPKGALTGYGDAVSPIPEHGVEEGAQVRKGIQGVQGGERGGGGGGGPRTRAGGFVRG